MGEAGRAPDTPLTMAPPTRDDGENEPLDDNAPGAGVMAPPPNGRAANGQSARLNGKPTGTKVDDSSASASDAIGTGSTPDEGVSPKQEKAEGTSPGQVVRQAMAATNNWFTGRTQKATSAAEPSDSAAPAAAAPSRTSVPAEPITTPAQSSTAPTRPAEATRPVPAAQAAETVPPSAATTTRRPPPLGSTAPWTAKPMAPKKKERRNRRQAHLTVARVEPWSVMKFSFVVSVIAFIVLFVAVAVLYAVLSSLGVFTSLQHLVSTVTSSKSSSGTDINSWFSASRILGYTGMLGSLNIVLITAICTIGSVIYNLIAKVFGGVEITLRETE